MISAQVLSIVACLASWLWWPTMAISLVAMALHQVVWCCRVPRVAAIRCMTGVSVLATILCIAAGIFEWVVLGNASWCGLFYFSDAKFSTEYDNCKEQLFAAMSFVTAAFWAASSICSLIFVQSGRYAKWEAKWDETFPEDDKEVAAVAVELGVVRESSEAAASEGVATNAVATSLEAAAVVVGVEDVTHENASTDFKGPLVQAHIGSS